VDGEGHRPAGRARELRQLADDGGDGLGGLGDSSGVGVGLDAPTWRTRSAREARPAQAGLAGKSLLIVAYAATASASSFGIGPADSLPALA